MGFLDKIFGGNKAPRISVQREYGEFLIQATPIAEGSGQYRICGVISRGEQSKQFIRSDLIGSLDSAEQITLNKGQLIIDQRGEALFDAENI